MKETDELFINIIIHKMMEILNNNYWFKKFQPDKRVQKNAFIYAEDVFNRTLREMKQSRTISDELYDQFRSQGAQPARLYGLPKLHKNVDNPPYRPILSMPKAYCTPLAK